MAVNVKIKTGILLLVLMVQSPLYPITDIVAKMLAGAAALGTTAFTSAVLSNEDSSFLVPITVGFGSALVAYYKYLYEHTPTSKLNRAKDTLKKIKPYGLVSVPFETIQNPLSDDDFLKLVSKLYRTEQLALVVAQNTLAGLDPEIKAVKKLLNDAKEDIHDDTQLKALHEKLSKRWNDYDENITDAIGRIAIHPKYIKQVKLDKKSQLGFEKLKIEDRKADAQEKSAAAQTEQAKASRSYTLLKWLKWFRSFFW